MNDFNATPPPSSTPPASAPPAAPGSPVGMHVPEPTPPADDKPAPTKQLLLLSLVPVVVTFLMLGILAVSAYASESAGVVAATVAFPIVGFVWSGFLGTALAVVTGNDKLQTKVGAGLGCGCMGSVMLFFMITFFFVGIFPAL